MTWTARQQAMLKAMGLVTWQPPVATPAGEVDEPTTDASQRGALGLPASRSEPSLPQGTAQAEPLVTARAVAPPVVTLPGGQGAFGGLDWADLPAAVAACRACGLCQSRQQPVVSVGQPGARWMVVGEAPDGAEESAGEPGAGPAGQLLDNMLRAVGLSRLAEGTAQRVVITPAVKCRPPRDRKPEVAELAACAPLLARQVVLVQPQVILAMGKVAIRQVLGTDEPLGRLRGRVHHYGDTPVIATYDAPYLLRQPADKAKAWEDLCLAASLVSAG